MQRSKEKPKNALHEQLKIQEELEAIQLHEQDAARELISEASSKLTDTSRFRKKSASSKGHTGYANHWECQVEWSR